MAGPPIRPQGLTAAVVVVDHEPELLELLRRTLVVEAYRILATTSSTDDGWLADNGHIDLVLGDLVISIHPASPGAIRVVMTGEVADRGSDTTWTSSELRTMIRRALAARLQHSARAIGRPSEVELSPRLQQTLDALMTGASEKQIASQFGISHHTMHQYVKTLFRRFGVTSRAELMASVLRR